MQPNHFVSHFGSQTAAAKAIGIRQSTVCRWVTAGRIPREWQAVIELVTEGQLRVSRKRLTSAG